MKSLYLATAALAGVLSRGRELIAGMRRLGATTAAAATMRMQITVPCR